MPPSPPTRRAQERERRLRESRKGVDAQRRAFAQSGSRAFTAQPDYLKGGWLRCALGCSGRRCISTLHRLAAPHPSTRRPARLPSARWHAARLPTGRPELDGLQVRALPLCEMLAVPGAHAAGTADVRHAASLPPPAQLVARLQRDSGRRDGAGGSLPLPGRAAPKRRACAGVIALLACEQLHSVPRPSPLRAQGLGKTVQCVSMVGACPPSPRWPTLSLTDC